MCIEGITTYNKVKSYLSSLCMNSLASQILSPCVRVRLARLVYECLRLCVMQDRVLLRDPRLCTKSQNENISLHTYDLAYNYIPGVE